MKLIMAILFLMVMINTVSHANESLRAKEPAPTTAPTPNNAKKTDGALKIVSPSHPSTKHMKKMICADCSKPTPDCECPEKQGDARQRKTDLYRQ